MASSKRTSLGLAVVGLSVVAVAGCTVAAKKPKCAANEWVVDGKCEVIPVPPPPPPPPSGPPKPPKQ